MTVRPTMPRFRRCVPGAAIYFLVVLPLNAYVFKSRGHMLNWGVDFRGGTVIEVQYAHAVPPSPSADGRAWVEQRAYFSACRIVFEVPSVMSARRALITS